MQERKKLYEMLFNATSLLAIATGLLYLFGSVWYMGYLRFFGIEWSLMPLSFESTLQNGAYGLWPILTDITFRLLILWIVLFVIITFWYKLKQLRMIKGIIEFIKEQNKSKFAKCFLKFYFFFILVMVFGLLLTRTFNDGKTYAQRRFDSFNSKNSEKNVFSEKSTVSLKTESGIIQITGFIIQCSSSYCLIYEENRAKVIPVSTITEVSNELIKPASPNK